MLTKRGEHHYSLALSKNESYDTDLVRRLPISLKLVQNSRLIELSLEWLMLRSS
uniref:Uncharacterized protein n=1 Tax=Myoviridae sp. ctBtT5 TaxID=2825048 RepID=A0A8S5Q0A5_9CAUD|nr:MAG TPA: hypothetical protein [Myoviridae sp. ctBtT5]